MLLASILVETVDIEVILDFKETAVATPSAVDELVKIAIVDGAAEKLIVWGAPSRIVQYFERSARLRDVQHLLRIAPASLLSPEF